MVDETTRAWRARVPSDRTELEAAPFPAGVVIPGSRVPSSGCDEIAVAAS